MSDTGGNIKNLQEKEYEDLSGDGLVTLEEIDHKMDPQDEGHGMKESDGTEKQLKMWEKNLASCFKKRM
jgi:hypothetical protein